jgi:hypothetical protein
VATLVISSRMDHEKNIPFTLSFANEFQRVNPKLRIAIFSPSEDLKEVKLLINSYSWIKKPKLYGDKGYDWHRSVILKQPFLVSFTTFILEDFNVSVAQARELGWPLVLSDWAVFRELGNDSIVRIKAKDIFKFNELKNNLDRKKLIKRIVYQSKESMKENCSQLPNSKVESELLYPVITKSRDLERLQNKWTSKNRQELIVGLCDQKNQEMNKYFKWMKKLFSAKVIK